MGETRHGVIAIVASAAGIFAVGKVLARLPPSIGTPICVLIHLSSGHPSHLAPILARETRLQVSTAEDGESLVAGHVYVPPSDRHLEISRTGRIVLSTTSGEPFTGPSAEQLFSTAAEAFGRQAVLVVLSGTGHSGSQSLTAAKARGATVLAEDPATAFKPSMPEAAIATGCVDFILPLRDMASKIASLAAFPES